MKDKAIIWIAAGGVAFWLFAAIPSTRSAVVDTAKSIVNEVVSKF